MYMYPNLYIYNPLVVLISLPITSNIWQEAEMLLKASKVKAEPKDDPPGADSGKDVASPVPPTANVFWMDATSLIFICFHPHYMGMSQIGVPGGPKPLFFSI